VIKKTFTLIELLVVIAIIGILAAVGTPIFQGFLTTAKINATQENHSRIVSKIQATFTQCATGSHWAKLGNKVEYTHECSDSINVWDNWFSSYFNGSSFKNPYKTSEQCCTTRTTDPGVGSTHISSGSGLPRRLIIKTNIGTEDGLKQIITSTIIKE